MFKPKTPKIGRLENSSGGAIRTHDLRVMSEANYPRPNKKFPLDKSLIQLYNSFNNTFIQLHNHTVRKEEHA